MDSIDSLPPQRLRDLVEAHADNEHLQEAIRWSRPRWQRWLPDHTALLADLPQPLAREDVRCCAEALDDTPQGAEALFVATMVWGFGGVGYGPYRTRRILDATPRAAARLQRVRRCLHEDGPVAAYRLLASPGECRLRWLGPAFGTKYLHFASPADAPHQALILDRIVGSWLEGQTGRSLRPWAWRTAAYEEYLDRIYSWAEKLGTSAERLETLIFIDAVPPESQWAGNLRVPGVG